MKNNFLFLLLMCITTFLGAQGVDYKLIHSDEKEIIIKISIPGYTTTAVEVEGTMMYKLNMKGAYPIEEAGAPELLKAAQSVIIPENSEATVSVVSSEFDIVSDFELAPSKGRLYRNVNPEEVPYTKGEIYNYDRYYGHVAELGDSYHIRDLKGISVRCFPFAYNPVKKQLKVYRSITLKISLHSIGSAVSSNTKISKEFTEIYRNHFINYQTPKYSSLKNVGEMLIITPDQFVSALEPFAAWKTKTGIPTTIVTMTTTGSTNTEIKNYITNFYAAHNLVYVVIVGDNNFFPTFTFSRELCDNYYSEIVGNDSYPDVILGKISAENIEQVVTQVQKAIDYEQSPAETSHFPTFCGIGSSEGPGYNGEYDYAHIRNLDNELLNFTYTSGYEFFEGSQGGLDQTGNPTAAAVSTALNNGVGIINYCGHGSDTYFVTSNFSNNNITQLTNYNKLPFIFSVACVNGNYANQTCFAEAWLRASKNGQHTGAVATMMSTMNQPWQPPMCGQDEITDVLTNLRVNPINRTFGGIAFDGLMKMLDVFDDQLTVRTWLVFGDPSLHIRTDVPQPLTVTHDRFLSTGATSMLFQTAADKTYIVLSSNDTIIAQGTTSNGSVTLSFNRLFDVNNITVCATNFNYLPYQDSIFLAAYDYPYLTCYGHSVNDAATNNNHLAEYGETVGLDVSVRNLGNKMAQSVRLSLSTDNEYVTMINSSYLLNAIDSFSNTVITDAFRFKVANNAPFQQVVDFVLTIQAGDSVFVNHFTQLLSAPSLSIGEYSLQNESVKTNHRLDLSESATINLKLNNEGDAKSQVGIVTIESLDGKIIINRNSSSVMQLDGNNSLSTSFRIAVSPAITGTSEAALLVKYRAGLYETSKIIKITIGANIEDWESKGFNSFEWAQGSNAWFLTTSNVYEGAYAARSAIIGHSANSQLSVSLTNEQSDSISFYYYVSCESGGGQYDRLEFYIDNVILATWDGKKPWTRAVFPVSAGTHTYLWKYVKDSYVSEEEDLAKIDYIVFPPFTKDAVSIDNVLTLSVSLYPNPTTDNVTVQMSTDVQDCCDGLLYDIYGRLLNRQKLSNGTTINMSAYSSGLYLLKIMDSSNHSQTIKIIKK